tara:strand:+ start:170 stop:511 length:342 start_codon:yes stop_codon:yes gene_type:complete
MNKVELSLGKYEEMRDRIEKLEKIIDGYNNSENVVVKVVNGVYYPHHKCNFTPVEWEVHEESALRDIIESENVTVKNTLLEAQNDIYKLKETNNELLDEISRLRTKKWYQFWE